MQRSRLLLAVVCCALVSPGAALDTIYDLLSPNGCGDYANLVMNTGPMYKLSSNDSGPYTVFAPKDSAFAHLPPKISNIFNFGNWRLAHEIVTFHIAMGTYGNNLFVNERKLPTWEGDHLRVNVYPNGSRPIQTANGGVIQKMLNASNGQLYVIDRLLYNIPRVPADRYLQESANASLFRLIAQVSESFSILRDLENVTLLLPVDKAFENNTLLNSTLLSNESVVQDLIRSHVINGTYFSSGLHGTTMTLPTIVKGRNVSVSVHATSVYVNQAKVLATDLSISNGVVHLIDSLLFQNLLD